MSFLGCHTYADTHLVLIYNTLIDYSQIYTIALRTDTCGRLQIKKLLVSNVLFMVLEEIVDVSRVIYT